jgi:membrane associated rhomboid family serine protease
MFTQIAFGHLFFNMFAVYMFGRVIEAHWGAKRFLIYYMVCGIGSGLIQLLVCHLTGSLSPTVGASGAVFGILLAFGMMFPNVPLYLMFIPIPIKAKYFVVGYGLIELYMGFANRIGDNVAHFAHLGGMLFGVIMILYWGRNHYNSPLNKLKNLFKKPVTKMKVTYGGENSRKSDYDYNAGKNHESAEIDRILEKIKKSGYNCLTDEEKKKLFDASKK